MINFWIVGSVMLCALVPSLGVAADAETVDIQDQAEGYQLVVDGQRFTVKGAGGDGDKAMLAAAGANAFRTWGVDENTASLLDEAQANGLEVALGIWIGHARHGFDYGDPKQVQEQFDLAEAAVKKYKDHPALLLWGVGNEMEEYAATSDPRVWKAVNDIAAMIQKRDPNHPTMTVIAEIGGDKLPSIKEYCPAIDIVGVNSYGGILSLPERYAAGGLAKPYLVTEFGPAGTWEVGRNEWDVPLELSSTEKAQVYADAYHALHADPVCLGSFAFTWGNKQEATATWFGLLLPDGAKLGAVDALTQAWTGSPPENLSPRIDRLAVAGKSIVEEGSAVNVEIEVVDPDGGTPSVEWVLFQEMEEFESSGDFRPTPPTFPEAIQDASAQGVTVKMPDRPGNYRLFAYVRDGKGGGAVANVPLKVQGKIDTQLGVRANVPLVVYGDHMNAVAFTPSGYMGETASISMNEKSTTQPHRGATCLEVSYNKSDAWGGVVWQSPANDWGDQKGGYDLREAGTLSFWARGKNGGEAVKFGFGLIGREKPFFDTGKAEKSVKLTKEWQQFSIPLAGQDMSSIKSGFYWTLAGAGAPITFYLDDIVYTSEGAGGADGATAAAPESANMPVDVLGDDLGELPWIPSGYMGEAGAITMDETSTEQPLTGATATKVTYANPGAWGGVVWQHPANDWGDQPGGHNLTGATTLTFNARGAKGGEKVKFGFGLLGADAAYPDSGKGETQVTLTNTWKSYQIDLAGKDLSQIKTGFYWTLAGQGVPVTFYLDDIAYTRQAGEPE